MITNIEETMETSTKGMSADPITAVGGKVKKRRGDRKMTPPSGMPDDIEDDVTTPSAVKDDDMMDEENFNLEEAFGNMFKGTNLSEEFKNNAFIIFETVVNQKVNQEKRIMEEQFQNDLNEEVDNVLTELTESVDAYFKYVVENWIDNNNVAIESAMKVEIAESLIEGIKNLVEEHNIDIDENDHDAIAEMENRVEESNDKYNDAINENIRLKKENDELNRETVFREMSQGLSDTEAEKLIDLSENISYKSMNHYREKIAHIKKTYFGEYTRPNDETEMLNESQEYSNNNYNVSPAMKSYTSGIDKLFTK